MSRSLVVLSLPNHTRRDMCVHAPPGRMAPRGHTISFFAKLQMKS